VKNIIVKLSDYTTGLFKSIHVKGEMNSIQGDFIKVIELLIAAKLYHKAVESNTNSLVLFGNTNPAIAVSNKLQEIITPVHLQLQGTECSCIWKNELGRSNNNHATLNKEKLN